MTRAPFNPADRFTGREIEWDEPPPPEKLEIIEDNAREALARGAGARSPYSWGLNPYRGCTHACAYCFAREYHEFLGYSAGADFERRIVIKPRIAELLEETFKRPSWAGDPIALSQVSDPYQPLERKLGLTRACLAVLARYRNPVVIITRSPLIARDADLLADLAARGAVRVNVSIPIIDPDLCRKIEPGTAPPAARLRAVSTLAAAGVPVGVSLAPVIPGLTDHLIPRALQDARAAGAGWAWMGRVRLPGAVESVFREALLAAAPDRAEPVLRRVAQESDPTWQATTRLFELWSRKLGFSDAPPFPSPSPFRRPGQGRQVGLGLT